MTRSSGIGSGAAGSVGAESSIPFPPRGSSGRLPATKRDWRNCCRSCMVARDWEAGDSGVSGKRRQAHRRGSGLLKRGRLWKFQKTSALVSRSGQRRDKHHASKMFPFSFFFRAAFLFRVFISTAWPPHWECFSLLPARQSGGC